MIINVLGKNFETFEMIGDGNVIAQKTSSNIKTAKEQKVTLKKNDLAVLIYRKK